MKKLKTMLAIMLLLGAVLWNGWVFGWLNHGLAGYLHMSISELEALGQPHASLFNILEDISGLSMIIGSLGLIAINKYRLGILTLVLVVITSIGALTLYDVAHPLDCNRYHSPVCVARVNANQVSRNDVLHQDESRITCYTTILLALLITVWAYTTKLPRNDFLSAVILAVGIIITLIILDTTNGIFMDAITERLWNVLVSLDIGFVALKLLQLKPSKA